MSRITRRRRALPGAVTRPVIFTTVIVPSAYLAQRAAGVHPQPFVILCIVVGGLIGSLLAEMTRRVWAVTAARAEPDFQVMPEAGSAADPEETP